jgi:hypothetical protein
MPRVYVVQEPLLQGRPKFSLEPARQYGDIVRLLDWEDGKAPFQKDLVVGKLARALADFRPDDYLLLAGHPVAMCLAALIASEASDGCVKFLSWNKHEGEYEVVEMDLNGLYTYL